MDNYCFLLLAMCVMVSQATLVPVYDNEESLEAAETRRAQQGWFKGFGFGEFGFREDEEGKIAEVKEEVKEEMKEEEKVEQKMAAEEQKESNQEDTNQEKPAEEEAVYTPVFPDFYYGQPVEVTEDQQDSEDTVKADEKQAELEQAFKEFYATYKSGEGEKSTTTAAPEPEMKKEEEPKPSKYQRKSPQAQNQGGENESPQFAYSSQHQITYFPKFSGDKNQKHNFPHFYHH